MQVVLHSVEEALEFTEKLKSGQISEVEALETDLVFADELSEVKIIIDGPSYHGTVPGDLAKGLWEYQLALYRAGAFAIYGVADTRKLTAEQREKFELIFTVSEGSTDLVAQIKETVECLKSVFSGMNGTQKLIAIVMVTAIVTGGYTYIQHDESKKTIALEQERTKQGETIKDTAIGVLQAQKIAQQYTEANETGLISLAKSACDATSIKMGKSTLNAEAIRDINRKSERTKATAEFIDGPFMVYEINSKEASKTTATLCDHLGREFSVTLDHQEFEEDKIARFWTAGASRTSVKLEVTLTVAPDGSIRKAQVLAIN